MRSSLRVTLVMLALVSFRGAHAADADKATEKEKNGGLPVLIVADEIPAMEVLAKELSARAHASATVVKQPDLPSSLASFKAVLVYIHGGLKEEAEKALISYAQEGGNLVLLHHSISSGKRKNATWLPAMGVKLPEGDFAAGGYKYIDGATWDVVNLAPANPITRGIKFPKTITYSDGKKHPALTLDETEIYLNHELEGPRTVLLGLKYQDPKTEKVYQQDTAAWTRPLGKGRVTYFMPGHKATDFQNPVYAQLIANAVKVK
jgi:type 1 glutamine amidotransferase